MAANNIVLPADQAKLMLDKLLSQYDISPKFMKMFQISGETIFQDIETQLMKIYNMCDIDNSTGNILDAVGSLIGLPRMPVLITSDAWILDITPFTDHIFSDKFYLVYALASDDIYRDAIKAYAINQNTSGDPRTLLTTLALIYSIDETDISVVINGTFDVTITINTSVNLSRRYLVDIYLTPNTGKLWSKVLGCKYTFIYT